MRAGYRFLAPGLRAAGYRVACTDLRGPGDSDATFTSAGDEETAGDVIALIEQLGGPAVVVGNSMGAGAAALVTAERPELVSGLGLAGPLPAPSRNSSSPQNCAAIVRLPNRREPRRKRRSWTVDEAREFLESARDDADVSYTAYVLVLASSGCVKGSCSDSPGNSLISMPQRGKPTTGPPPA